MVYTDHSVIPCLLHQQVVLGLHLLFGAAALLIGMRPSLRKIPQTNMRDAKELPPCSRVGSELPKKPCASSNSKMVSIQTKAMPRSFRG